MSREFMIHTPLKILTYYSFSVWIWNTLLRDKKNTLNKLFSACSSLAAFKWKTVLGLNATLKKGRTWGRFYCAKSYS